MQDSDPRIRSMLRQAQRVAEGGKRTAAEQLYRELIQEAPQSAAAWIGLAQVLRDTSEKEGAYQQALVLEPGNEAALAGLSALAEAAANPGMAEAAVPVAVATAEETPAKVETVQAGNGVAAAADSELFCTNHPNRRTNLRCNRCGRPMCTSCVRLTPVGYRCKDCIYEQQEAYFNATAVHYVVGAVVALPLGAIGGLLATALGFWIIFVAAGAGTLMGRIVFRLIGRRRGRWLPHLVAAMLVIGALSGVLVQLVGAVLLFASGNGSPFSLIGIMWALIFAGVAAGSAYYQMK
jgi:hypothetical protein